MRAIFISYRRDDAEGQAGRLFEDLEERFGKASVFMDVTGIEPGRDFRKVIEQQVASCGVLLAIIGKDWLTATDADGHRRLDDPADFVRLETAAALKRDIPVIPVLVRGAKMPRAEQLPEVLADLSFRNSVELSHARWVSDVQLLINALLPYVDVSPDLARTEAGGADKAIPRGAVASGPSTTPAGLADVPTERAGDAVGRVSSEGSRSGSAATKGGGEDGGTDRRSGWWAGGGLAAIVVAGLGYLAWDRSEPEAGGERRATQTPAPSANPAATVDPKISASAPAARARESVGCAAGRRGRGPGSAADPVGVRAASGAVDGNGVHGRAARFRAGDAIAAGERKCVGREGAGAKRRDARRVFSRRAPCTDGWSRGERTDEAGQGHARASRAGRVFEPARDVEAGPRAGARGGEQPAFGSRDGRGRSRGDCIAPARRRTLSARATLGRTVRAGAAGRATGNRDSARAAARIDPDVAGLTGDHDDRRDPSRTAACAARSQHPGRAAGRRGPAEPD